MGFCCLRRGCVIVDNLLMDGALLHIYKHDDGHLILFFTSLYRKDEWPEKRMAMDDRYGRSDFGRQDRYQDFDHRERGRFQDNMAMDRRDNARGMGAVRDGQVSTEVLQS